MRKQSIILSSVAGLILLLSIFIIACNSPAGMGNNDIQSVPADFDAILSVKALLDDSFIYLSVDRNTATYYRHYINDNKIVVLGTVENFYLGTNTVLIDNTLYFYASVLESDNGDTSNVLFSINLSENKMNSYKNDDNSLAGLLAYQFDGNIITLKNVVDEENITTYLDIFDVNSKSWKQENINVVDSNTYIGSAIFGLYSNKEALYVLHDECLGGQGNVNTTLKVYDSNINEIQTINIANDLRDYILSSRIQEMAVFGNYIYTQNTSNYSLLGKIEGNTIEPIIKERNLSLNLNQTSTNTPFFYVRRSNKCYILDTETETITPIDLQIGNEHTIKCILANEKNILLICYSNDNKTDYMYYLKRDNLSNTYIPCE
jgi:hypothetical protein